MQLLALKHQHRIIVEKRFLKPSSFAFHGTLVKNMAVKGSNNLINNEMSIIAERSITPRSLVPLLLHTILVCLDR